MHPNFKQNILAQAVAVACLSMVNSGAYADTDACPPPVGGVVDVLSGPVATCELNGAVLNVNSWGGTVRVTNVNNSASIPANNTITLFAAEGGTASIGNISNSAVMAGIQLNSSQDGETSIGTVTNTGTINGQPILGVGIGINGSGIFVAAQDSSRASITTVDNSGTISGTYGVLVSANNINYGFLPSSVVDASASIGTLTNSGSIIGNENGIEINRGQIGTITNDRASLPSAATIHGTWNGINLNNTATLQSVVNYDDIIGAIGSGVNVSGNSSIGSIDNRGKISGGVAGITVEGDSKITTISNSGKISGGIRASNNSSIGAIDNHGEISGGGVSTMRVPSTEDVAIDLEYAALPSTINNFGKITGDVKLGGNPIYYGFGISPFTTPLSGSMLNLENASVVTGKVTGGPSSIVNVNGAFATENTFDVGQFNISRGGNLAMNHDITVQTQPGLRNDGKLYVAAGKSVTIHGSYVQGSDGIFATGVSGTSGATQYGKLEVTGTADLSASNKIGVLVTSEDTIRSGVLPGVLKAGTLVTGPLENSVIENSALWNFTALQNGNSIDLKAELAAIPEPTPTPTPQPQPRVGTAPMIQNTGIGMPAIGAARVIDQFLVAGNATGDMQTVLNNLGALGTQQEVAQAVSQLVPVMTGALAQSTLGAMHGTNRVVQARMESARGLSSGDEVKTNHGWIKPFGSWANQDDHEGVSGYRSDTYGFVLGADKELARNTRLGAAFSYSNTRVKGNADASAKVDTYQAIVYGSHSLDERTEVNFQADVGMNSNDTSRRIRFADLNRSASANYNSWNTHLGVGMGRLYDIGAKATFTPSLRADYLYIRDKGYTESGADALDLKVNGKSTDELVFGVDGKFNYALTDAVDLTANLGVGYDALSGRSSITTAFVGGGAAFITEGTDPSPWLGRGGLGLSTRYANGMEVAVRYDVETRKHFINQTASLKLRMPF